MRCALECSIEGRLKLPGRIDTPWFDGKHLTIELDDEGFASTIRLEGPVAPDDIISMRVLLRPGQPTHFNSSGGLKIREELERDLQMIESTLGVFCGIRRVRWEHATSIVIPETPEEQEQIQWNNFKLHPATEESTRAPNVEEFGCFLQMGYFARDLATTMSFFREGNMDMSVFRYITAFFSYYFILEGLYANGHFRSREVRAEFAKSAVLAAAIEEVMKLPIYSRPARIGQVMSIDDFLKVISKRRTVEGIIHMMVWFRGDLHHFVNNPKKLEGSPFTHQRYEVLASFTRDVSLHVLMHEILARFPKDGSKSCPVT